MRTRHLSLFFICLCTCLSLGQPTLLVKVSAIGPSVSALEVSAVLQGVPSNEKPLFPLPAVRDTYSFVMLLPASAKGTVQLTVRGLDGANCTKELGTSVVDLSKLDVSHAIEVAISLQAPAFPECPAGSPVILQATPALVSTVGGEVITINGLGFQPGAVVKVGGAATPATVMSPTQLQIAAPGRPGQAGSVGLAVENPDGSQAQADNLLSYYLGSLSFSGQVYSVPLYTQVIIAADLNGDGQLDLAIMGKRPTFPALGVAILLNQGNGTFVSSAVHQLDGSPTALLAADFNQDGVTDLAAFGQGPTGVYMIFQPLDVMAPRPFWATGLAAQNGMAVADFNRDGLPDLAVSGGYPDFSTGFSIFLNPGQGSFPGATTTYSMLNSAGGGSVTIADFNSDGWPDVVLQNSNSLDFYLNQGTGGFPMAPIGGLVDIPTGYSWIYPAADLDADGLPDFALYHPSEIRVLYDQKPGITGGSPATYPAVGNGSILFGDLNGDKRPDIVRQTSNTSLQVLFNLGSGVFSAPIMTPTPDNGSVSLLADLNGDGLLDVVGLQGDISKYNGSVYVSLTLAQ